MRIEGTTLTTDVEVLRVEDSDGNPVTVSTAGGKAKITLPASGGSQPVTCVLVRDAAMDIHDGGIHYVEWDLIWDNIYTQNALEELPDGIGLTLGADNVETTEAGTWALSLTHVAFGGDASWTGAVSLDNINGGADQTFQVQASGARRCSLAATYALPSGAQLATAISTVDDATADPFNIIGVHLTIVRLA